MNNASRLFIKEIKTMLLEIIMYTLLEKKYSQYPPKHY